MEINITITVTVPDDGTTPIINVNSEAIKPTPATFSQAEELFDEAKKTVDASATKARPQEELPKVPKTIKVPKVDKPKEAPQNSYLLKEFGFPERNCLFCGKPYKPNSTNQRFHHPSCKGKYYRQQQRLGESTTGNPIPEPKIKTFVPNMEMSKDKFYQSKLKEATRKSERFGKAYDRYTE